MRLKAYEGKMSRDSIECSDGHVDIYRKNWGDHQFTKYQKLQFLHIISRKDETYFFKATVDPQVATFQQEIDFISDECRFLVQQAQVKNYP